MIYFLPFILIPILLVIAELRAKPEPPEDLGERPDLDALERHIIQHVTGKEPPARITAPDPKGDYSTDEETRQRMFEQSADTIEGRVAPWQ